MSGFRSGWCDPPWRVPPPSAPMIFRKPDISVWNGPGLVGLLDRRRVVGLPGRCGAGALAEGRLAGVPIHAHTLHLVLGDRAPPLDPQRTQVGLATTIRRLKNISSRCGRAPSGPAMRFACAMSASQRLSLSGAAAKADPTPNAAMASRIRNFSWASSQGVLAKGFIDGRRSRNPRETAVEAMGSTTASAAPDALTPGDRIGPPEPPERERKHDAQRHHFQ